MFFVRELGRGIATLVAFAVGALATAAVMLLVVQSHDLLDHITSDAGVAVVELLRLGMPIAGGVLLARLVWKKLKSRTLRAPGTLPPWRRRVSKVALWLVGLAYLVTATFGSPAVQSDLDRRSFEAWKRLEARDHSPGWQEFPVIKTLLALPVAPGLIATYHESQIGMLAGWGGWQLHLWYGSAPKRLVRLTMWVS
jgi:hypothetical protein